MINYKPFIFILKLNTCYQFEVSLVYIASFRPARAAQTDTILKKRKKKKVEAIMQGTVDRETHI